MKRTLFALLISCSPLAAFHGFYVGGSLGGHLTEATQAGDTLGAYTFLLTAETFFNPLELQKRVFDRGFIGSLYAGYGVGWRSLYLAAEGFMQFSYANLQSRESNTYEGFEPGVVTSVFIPTAKVDAKLSYFQAGMDLLPGWSPNSTTLLYGRVGIGGARANLHSVSIYSGALITDRWSLPLSLSESKTFVTLRAGGGLEQRVSQRLSLRGDYIFTDYGKLSVQGSREGRSAQNQPTQVSGNANLHLYDHAIMLGLSYRFCCQRPIYIPLCTACAYQGYYLNGALGGSILTANQNGSATSYSVTFNATQIAEARKRPYNNQFQGMLSLGYGESWGKTYLGGEVFAAATSDISMDFRGNSVVSTPAFFNTITATSYETKVKSSTWQYGVDIRPGVRLSPVTLLYGRVGISAAKIQAHSVALTTFFDDLDVMWGLAKEVSAKTWNTAFRLGLGIEQALTSKLHLRADYIYTNYGTISFDNTAISRDFFGDFGTPVVLYNSLSSHLQNNTILVGLSYYFH